METSDTGWGVRRVPAAVKIAFLSLNIFSTPTLASQISRNAILIWQMIAFLEPEQRVYTSDCAFELLKNIRRTFAGQTQWLVHLHRSMPIS